MPNPSTQARLYQPEKTAEQEEWLARVAKIAPVIEQYRDQGERDRVTPQPVFEALRDSGIPRMWVSREFGGEQVGIETGIAVLRELARLDASVAWQMGVQGAVGRLSDYLPVDSALELFQHNTRLVIGGVKPYGTTEPVDGGYMLEGVWSFASGIAHAGWLVCMSLLTRNGKPVMTPAGPDIRVPFIRVEDAEVMDTWYPLGLRGTGSNHYRVRRMFVPDDLTITREQMQKAPERPSRAYPVSYYDFGPFTVAPIALGIARDALDAFKELAAGKVPASGTATLGSSHVVQDKLGRAEMLLYTADLLLADAARHAVQAGDTGGDGLATLLRMTGASVAENTVAAVDSLFELAGSSSVYASSRLERCFRDIHSATKHIGMSYTHFEMAGQYLLTGNLGMRR